LGVTGLNIRCRQPLLSAAKLQFLHGLLVGL
jgi:hypothetical protein